MEDTLDKLSETYEQQVADTADRLAKPVGAGAGAGLGRPGAADRAGGVLLPLLSIYSVLGA